VVEPLFRLAEDSDIQLASYLDLGRVLVARDGDALVGHVQVVPRGGDEVEIKSLAVVPDRQRAGLGRTLVEGAIEHAARAGVSRVLVSTAAADTGALRFYQRCGFRMLAIDRDAFVPETGYPDPILIDGVAIRDRVWFSMELDTAGR
jgi:ribosomal protein S18 acetylase RimI-like enzyme